MQYEATLVISTDKKTGEVKERYLTNVRPAQKSLEEYLAPAVKYLATVMDQPKNS